MANTHKYGYWIVWLLAISVIPLWLITFGDTTFEHNNKAPWILSSQVAALSGYALFALSFVLSSRIKWLEDYFGGMDKMLHFHHTIAIIAGLLILIHPLLLALRWIPENMEKTLTYLLPMHRRTAVNLGSIAFFSFMVLMIFSVFIKIPYDKWKVTHKLFGVVFMISALHVFLLQDLVWNNVWLASYLLMLTLIAIIAWVYRSIYLDYIADNPVYTVTGIRDIDNKIIEIEMLPDGNPVRFNSGQFYFFRFFDEHIPRESHPFTICTSPESESIQIVVKALGDYTENLLQNLKPSIKVQLEGPYGRFFNGQKGNKQIWIAGGVGITPFLCKMREWMQSNNTDVEVDFYYCVNEQSEAVFLAEFEEYSRQNSKFRVHLEAAKTAGYLDAGKIPFSSSHEIYICGPKVLRNKIMSEFKNLSVSKKKVYFEDFDFF